MKQLRILHWHYPLYPNKLSIFDLKSDKSFFGFDDSIQRINAEDFKLIDSRLQYLFARIRDNQRIYLYLSNSFLKLLELKFPVHLEKIKDATKTGLLEPVLSTALHDFSYLCNEKLFEKSISLHRKVLADYFTAEPSVFVNTAGIYDDKLAQILADQNVKFCISTANQWHLEDVKINRFYRSAKNKKLILLLANGGELDEKMISTVMLNGFGSNFHGLDISSISICSDALPEKETIDQGDLSTYSVKMPLSSPVWNTAVSNYLNSPLQKALFEQIDALSEHYLSVLSKEELESILAICQHNFLEQLGFQRSDDAIEMFISAMNFIARLSLKYS